MSRRARSQYDKLPNLNFITTTITNYERIFANGSIPNDSYCKILIDSLKHLLEEHSASLIAYVIMPSHLHFIVFTPEDESISDFMRDFKKFTSNQIKKQLHKDKEFQLLEMFKKASDYGTGYRVWMKNFDNYIISTDHMLEVKMGYIHDNPRRAGLVKEITEWKYSSAKNYFLDDHSLIAVGFPDN